MLPPMFCSTHFRNLSFGTISLEPIFKTGKPFDLTNSYVLVFDIPSTIAISCTDNINGSSS